MIDDEVTHEIKRAWGGISKYELQKKNSHTLKEILSLLCNNNYDISGGFGSSFKDAIVLNNFDGMVNREYGIIEDIMYMLGREYTIDMQKLIHHEHNKYDVFELNTSIKTIKPQQIDIHDLRELYANNKVEIYFKI